MAAQTAVIIERRFVDDDGREYASRQPPWKVDRRDAVEALPDDEARWWALDKHVWIVWERDADVERVIAFVRQRYRERSEAARRSVALDEAPTPRDSAIQRRRCA